LVDVPRRSQRDERGRRYAHGCARERTSAVLDEPTPQSRTAFPNRDDGRDEKPEDAERDGCERAE
jgi:hypothetical protein